MRKLILFLLLFVGLGVNASAQTQVTASRLMGLGLPAPLAKELAKLGDGTGTILANGDYAQAYDESGNVHDILGVDANGNTELLSPSGEEIEIFAGTDVDITASAGDVNINANLDDVVVTATDDIVLQGQGAGDLITLAGGGTDVDLTVADNLVTVADGTVLYLKGNGTYLRMEDESGNPHDVLRVTSSGNTELNTPSGEVMLFALEGVQQWQINTLGQFIGAGTGTMGWSLQSAANQSCSTTCTTPAVFGFDTGSSVVVGPSDATADSCICAGAS